MDPNDELQQMRERVQALETMVAGLADRSGPAGEPSTTPTPTAIRSSTQSPAPAAGNFDRRAFLRRAAQVGGAAAVAGGALSLADSAPAAAATGSAVTVGTNSTPTNAADPPTRLTLLADATSLSPVLFKVDNYTSGLLAPPSNSRVGIIGTTSGTDSTSNQRIGVYGATDTTQAASYGVYGVGATGVYGSGANGVYGISATQGGNGVYAYASGTSAIGVNVTSTKGAGVYASGQPAVRALSSATSSYGVQATSSGAASTAVSGIASGANSYGVVGSNDQSDGVGVGGQTTDGIAVQAAADGSGNALVATQDGSGGALNVVITDSNNTSSAALSTTAGAGEALYGSASNGIAGRFTGTVTLRLAGPGTSGPPTDTAVASQVNDVKAYADGLWVCIVAGSPGTWRKVVGPATAGAFHSIAPSRVYDSRFVGSRKPLAAGETRTISVADSINGSGGVATSNIVPAGATAIAFNLTITATQRSGFITAYPAGVSKPLASSINWSAANQTIANGLIGAISSGELSLYASGATHVIVDVSGYYL